MRPSLLATSSSRLFLLLLLSACSIRAALVEHFWNIEWVDDVNPDGLYPRKAIGVNGSWPPPVINVNASDTLKIHATNLLNTGVGTSIHSHGMFFNQTGYFDGAVSITQCPIPQGQTFTYEPLNSDKSPEERRRQYGTFWVHAHNNDQYTDGLRAPYIIHPDREEEKRYSYDDDFTVILGDWYHSNYTDLVKNQFLNRNNPTGAEPVPKSGLMYFAHTSNSTSVSPYLPGFNENATLTFEPGKTYRLRLINMSALAAFYFYISGHDMEVIEVEGVDVQPYPMDMLTLAVAQRMSILVKARNDTVGLNWRIFANMDSDMFDVVPDDLQLNVTSTISYGPGNEYGEDKVMDEYAYFDDTLMVPLDVEPLVEADVSHEMNFNFDTYSDGKNYASFNNVSFVAPQVPAMFSELSMASLASNPAIYGPNSNAFVFSHMDMVEVRIYNYDSGKHPFHLHGHHFQLVHKSQDITSDDASINPPFNPNQTNPMRRDTVVVPPGGTAWLRFRADNPGTWFFHCHIDPHLDSGLAAIFIEAPEQSQQLLKPPSFITDQCSMQNIAVQGNAGGLNSTTDFGTLSKGPTYLVTGWTPKAIVAFTFCTLTALLGLWTVVMYAWGDGSDQEEDEDEEVIKKNK
ncbi:putative iron transport multicopper oxidase [Violaceomyces palustris]|uniref:Iron transport multicopper oxidase n=1 Tax=Violaceomyces palustris TaxID=1673888 RepID=A0ACD0NL45_9BASI|nr:putative iron transport multicopper oxidase [Violaceomyces palustris]